MEIDLYRKIFRDVVKGRSDAVVEGTKYYIKHLSALDQVDIDEIKEKYYDSAIKRGIPTLDEVLDSLNKEGIWTKEDEEAIKREEMFIEQLQQNKTQLVLKSQIDQQNKTIKETREKIESLRVKKHELIGVNADGYSEKRANDYYIIKSFYIDKDMETPLFKEEKEFNELYADEVLSFINKYNEIFKMFEELKIQ